jgi:glycyl-tRNA synthetase alpha subunit
MKIVTFMFINLAFAFLSCGNKTNETLPQVIEEIWIYNYFNAKGYTTASAYGQIIRLEEQNISKFKLEQNDLDSLCRIITESSPGIIFHTKWGGGLVFAEAILKDGKRLKIFISSDAISIEIGKNYWIKNEKNKKWLTDFKNRIIKSLGNL